MKKTFRFLSMAALALVGAVMTGCSSDDSIFDQQPANSGKTVTLTMSVGLNVGGETRALAADGTKTFAAGEKMAVIYKKTGGATAMAETVALKDDGDITNNGKTATFTVTLDDPDKTQNVTYVYPAAMVNSDGSVKNDALASQDGTLASLASNLDYCTNSGAWTNGTDLPSLTLDNQFAILALTLKNGAGSREITSSITGLTVSDGTNSYTVSRSAAPGPIYVAIRPTTAALELTATGAKEYTKTTTSREYAAGSGHSLPLRMLTVISWSQSELEGMGSLYSGGVGSQSLKGVTLTKPSTESTFYNYGDGKYIGGEFQFSTVLGKFTEIAVTATGTVEGSGWSGNVWTGTAANIVNFAADGFNVTNIVFTIEEDIVAVSGITLNKASTSIEAGQNETLTATVLPAEADDKTVTWSSDNTAAATVDASGNVTAVAAGTAHITATASGYSATCEVTVTAAPEPEPPTPSGDATSFTIDGVTVYYVLGQTWAEAEDHPQNEWYIDGDAVSNGYGGVLYWLEDGWNDKQVSPGDIIDKSNEYFWW